MGCPRMIALRMSSRVSPRRVFGACFRSWTQAVAGATGGEILTVDGKTARGSQDR